MSDDTFFNYWAAHIFPILPAFILSSYLEHYPILDLESEIKKLNSEYKKLDVLNKKEEYQ